MAELEELATSAGGEVIGSGTQKLDTPVASTFIGSGKADEFAVQCKQDNVDTVIFDDDLSPPRAAISKKFSSARCWIGPR